MGQLAVNNMFKCCEKNFSGRMPSKKYAFIFYFVQREGGCLVMMRCPGFVRAFSNGLSAERQLNSVSQDQDE